MIYLKNNCMYGGEMGFCARFMKNRDKLNYEKYVKLKYLLFI